MYNSITRILCLGCNEYLPTTDFLRNPDGHFYEPACTSCRSAYSKAKARAPYRHIRSDPKIRCIQCGKEKRRQTYPFHHDIDHPVCIVCTNRNNATLTQEARRHRKVLKHRYRLTENDYSDMFLRQFGLCAICGNAPDNGKRLFIDHDHTTGQVRGLLCMNCNSMLGHAKDKVTTLNNAIKYLKRTG